MKNKSDAGLQLRTNDETISRTWWFLRQIISHRNIMLSNSGKTTALHFLRAKIVESTLAAFLSGCWHFEWRTTITFEETKDCMFKKAKTICGNQRTHNSPNAWAFSGCPLKPRLLGMPSILNDTESFSSLNPMERSQRVHATRVSANFYRGSQKLQRWLHQ